MALEDTGLEIEVRKIINSGAKPVHHQWECRILAGDNIVIPIKVLSIDVERQYDQQYSDRIFIDVALGLGTYNHRVYPHRENLTVELIKTPIRERGQEELPDEPIDVRTYRGVLVKDSSEAITMNRVGIQSEETANLTDIKSLKMQLVDPALERIRLMTVGGIYRNTTPGDVLRQVMTNVSSQLSLDDDHRVFGVDMLPYDNTEVRDHVVVPHGTPLVELPFYLQAKAGGIYSTGLGFYLQSGIWYIYPEHKTDRFSTTPRGLTIINLPPNKYPEIERTYRTTTNQLIILSTGEVLHSDGSDRLQDNLGNGVRYTDSRKVIEGFGEINNNKVTVSRAKNNSEYVAFGKATGLNNTPVSAAKATSNPFEQASLLAARKGATIQLKWENSEWGLLFPGMPVRFLYYENDRTQEAEGVILRAHHYIESKQPGLILGGHRCNTALTIFVDNVVEWSEPELV